MDGIPVGPIYGKGNHPALALRPPGSPWIVIQRIDRGGADVIRDDVAAALRGGATGIELIFTSGTATHGRGISSDAPIAEIVSGLHATVRLDAGVETPGLALNVRDRVRRSSRPMTPRPQSQPGEHWDRRSGRPRPG
jgi:hypothetical protein